MGGLAQEAIALPMARVESTRESRMSLRLAGVARQSTERPQRLMRAVAPSSSRHHGPGDLASQAISLAAELWGEGFRVRTTISQPLAAKWLVRVEPRKPRPPARMSFGLGIDVMKSKSRENVDQRGCNANQSVAVKGGGGARGSLLWALCPLPWVGTLLCVFLVASLGWSVGCAGAAEGGAVRVVRDIDYGEDGDAAHRLDLHLPAGKPKPPLIVWVHGGAWRSGSKASMPLGSLVEDGYAVASVDYRLSTQARFPAQVHDVKAAIRFLRARAEVLGLGLVAQKVMIAGDSAGGHLAAVIGVSNGVVELEGTVGKHGVQSSDTQGILSFYGASNLETILKQSTPFGLNMRVPALELLLGGQPEAVASLARLASPVAHVDSKDPPLLMFHGDQDPQMPINQSHELEGAYKRAGVWVRFEVVHGAAHGGAIFYDAERLGVVRAFLKLLH